LSRCARRNVDRTCRTRKEEKKEREREKEKDRGKKGGRREIDSTCIN